MELAHLSKSRWENDCDVNILVPGLDRPLVKAGGYSFEATNGEPKDVVHSGTQAVLHCESPEIGPGLFFRKA